MYGFDQGGMMFGGGLTMLLWWLLPIGLVVWVVFYLLKPSAGQGGAQNSALDILKERYAKGEIGKDEFEQKKRDLGG